MSQIKWGIVGCGAVTEVKSGPAFYKTQDSSLHAVAARNKLKAIEYAKRHQVTRVFDTVEELILSPDIDAVYIATPPSSHMPLTLKVAAAGKPCCVEKPMAMNYTECEKMLAAFEKIQQPLFVAYYRRSLPRFLQIKNWLNEKQIGEVRQVNWLFAKPANEFDLRKKTNWRTDPKIAGAGYFMDLACHGLNLFQFLLGDIVAAKGFSQNQQQLYDAEDAVSACWLFANGILGSGSWNFAAYQRLDEVQIIGDKGRIVFSMFNDQAIKLETEKHSKSMEIANPAHVQYFHVHNMNQHLRQKSTHPSLGESAARTNWIMDKILGNSEVV